MEDMHRKKRSFWTDWGAVFILALLFVGSWAGQFVTQLQAQRQEAQQHGQPFSMDDFWPQYWGATFENWQSEWLQLATQALLISGFSSYLFRKQDEEHYKTQAMIDELRQELRQRN